MLPVVAWMQYKISFHLLEDDYFFYAQLTGAIIQQHSRVWTTNYYNHIGLLFSSSCAQQKNLALDPTYQMTEAIIYSEMISSFMNNRPKQTFINNTLAV